LRGSKRNKARKTLSEERDEESFRNAEVAQAQRRTKRMQERCRSEEKIFRRCKVFNTDVDKFVEKTRWTKANLSFFNEVIRIAQILCNNPLTKQKLFFGHGKQKMKCFVSYEMQRTAKFQEKFSSQTAKIF